jgi:hypothetical protein
MYAATRREFLKRSAMVLSMSALSPLLSQPLSSARVIRSGKHPASKRVTNWTAAAISPFKF